MQIITICGLPNRNGGLSTSDTGRATELRDGWNDALCRAKATEDAYKEADQRAMHLILKICSAAGYCKLDEADIQAEFSMHNYDNIQSKSQVLIAMLQNNKIHPKLAFEASGLFIDPESAYTMSMEFYEEEKRKLEEQMATTANADSNIEQRSSENTDGKPMSNPILKASAKQNESSEKN